MTIREAPRHRPAPPADLSEASKEAWPGLVADLAACWGNPSAVHLETLGDLLRARDRAAAVAAKLAEEGLTVSGSTGQTQRHPLLAVERELRREWRDGVEALGLRPSYEVGVAPDGRLRRRRRGE